MSKLQQLLDEKFPDSEISHIQRQAFTEGYNEGVASLREANDANPFDTTKVLRECRKMIEEGYSLGALKLYKDTMGCSLTDAKAILNL